VIGGSSTDFTEGMARSTAIFSPERVVSTGEVCGREASRIGGHIDSDIFESKGFDSRREIEHAVSL